MSNESEEDFNIAYPEIDETDAIQKKEQRNLKFKTQVVHTFNHITECIKILNKYCEILPTLDDINELIEARTQPINIKIENFEKTLSLNRNNNKDVESTVEE